METSLKDLVASKNELVKQGQIVKATETFFSENAKTIDFDGTITNGKDEMMEKMVGFANAIEKVNEITLHHTSTNNNISFSEFTFHFDMKDGSQILWHEIIRTVWENGKITEEQYFKS